MLFRSDNNTFKNFTIEKMHQSLKINSILPWIIIRMSMQHMRNKKWGKIINTSSIGVDYGGGINSFNYSISKYVNEFIPIEIKKHFKFNIFYNVLKIGITETKIHNKIYNKSLKKRIKLVPMKKIAKPIDIANYIDFLISDLNKFINGQIIKISGGE